jgi:hypothetical protein
MKLIVCIPGNNFSEIFLQNILHFQSYCFAKNIKVGFSISYSPNLYVVRNMLLGGSSTVGIMQKPWQGKVSYDYILWLDSDIIFTIEDFEKLLASKKQIVSGLYFLHDERREKFAAIKNWDENYFKNNGAFEWLSREDISGKKELFTVDHIGMGFMLMKAGVLENLEYPWFRPMIADFLDIKEICTEDVMFCHHIKQKKFNVWVHPEVIVRHEKKILL